MAKDERERERSQKRCNAGTAQGGLDERVDVLR